MTNPTTGLDPVPVYGFYFVDERTPDSGDVFLKVTQRLTRVDGRRIYAEGATVKRTIGQTDADAATRDAVRAAWRSFDQAEVERVGGTFDGAAWDAWWAVQVTGAIFAPFPAMDDPDLVHDPANPYQIEVTERLTSGGGRTYSIQVQLADLAASPPGVNLGLVAVPPDSAYVPAPVYQKGVAGGVAALDAQGFVLDAAGNQIKGGGGTVDTSTLLAKANNLTDLPDKQAARTALQLGTAATHAVGDFEPAGAVASEATARQTAITTAINALVNGAPGALDTLNELAAQLGSDETAAGNLTTLVGAIRNLSDPTHAAALSATIAGQAEPVGHAAPVIRNVADWKMWQQDMAAWTVSGAASSNVADTSHPLFGTKALTMTTDGAGGFANASVTGLTAVDFARKQLQVVVEVDAPTLLSSLKAVLGTGGFVNGYNLTLQLTSSAGTAGLQVIQAGVPTVLSVSFQDSSAVGTPTISNINALRIQAKDTATGTGVKVTVHAVMYSDVATLAYPNGAVVSWGFDDGYASQEVMVRYLAKLGQRVTLFPIKSLIDSGPAWLTTALLREFQDRLGAEVCGHAYTQAHHDNRLTSLSTPDLEADFAADRAWLKSRGFHGFDVTAYPGGIYSDAVKSTARRYWGAARGVVSNTKETFPAGDPYLIRGYPFDASVGGPTKAQIKTAVDNCVAFGGHLNLVVHDGVSGTATAGTVQVALADFYEVADYVAASGVAVRTLSEVLREQRTSVAPALGALSDVSVSSPASGDVPTWNATTKKWTNAQPAAGGGAAAAAGEWLPADHGLIAWAYDPIIAATSSIPTTGLMQMVRVKVRSATTITNILLSVSVAGATLTAGQCFAALYDSNRNLLATTADRATAWQTAAVDIAPLSTPQAVAAGDYFIGFWWRGTTGPSFARQSNASDQLNVNLATANARWGTSSSGLTTAAPNPAAALAKAGIGYWAAVS